MSVSEKNEKFLLLFDTTMGKKVEGTFSPRGRKNGEGNKRSIMPWWTRSQLCMLISTTLLRTYGYRGLFRSLAHSALSPPTNLNRLV